MSDLKYILPTIPKSIEEHDKEVRKAWCPYENSTASEIESKLRSILNKELFRYYIQTLVSQDLYTSVDVSFHNSDFYAYIMTMYDVFDEEFIGGFKVKKIYVNLPEPSAEVECSTIQEVNDILCEWFDIKAKQPSDYKCEFCCDGDRDECGKSLLRDSISIFDTPIVDIDVFIDGVEGLKMLVTNASDATIIRKVIKIKHCPMCGRLLDNKHEQDNLRQLMKETMLDGISEGLADAILKGDGRLAEKIEESKNLIDKFKEAQ